MSEETINNNAEETTPSAAEEVSETVAVEEAAPVAEAAPEAATPESTETAVSTVSSIKDLKVGMALKGKVTSIELYGAFVNVGVGKDALLHISQLGKRNVRNVEDVVKAGEEITVYVLKVDAQSERIALSLEKPPSMPIDDIKVGDIVTGTVVRIETFGAFVDVGAERPGMIHVSELATNYVQSPADVVRVGEEIRAKVIKVNKKKNQIDLSIKAIEEDKAREENAMTVMPVEDEKLPTAMELALRRAMESSEESSAARAARERNASNKKRKALDDVLARTLKSN